MNRRLVAKELLAVARLLRADVGDVEIVEPIGEKPVKKRRTKRMKQAFAAKERVKVLSWKGTEYDDEYNRGDLGVLEIGGVTFEYAPITGEAKESYGEGVIKVQFDGIRELGNKLILTAPRKKFVFQRA